MIFRLSFFVLRYAHDYRIYPAKTLKFYCVPIT